MSGDVRNVYMHDCEFEGTDRAVRIKSRRGRGGIVENVFVENLRVKNMQYEVVILSMEYGADRNQAFQQKPPTFRKIHFKAIVGDGAPTAILAQGLEDSPITGIDFENITIASTRGVVCNNARDFTFESVVVTPATGPVFDLTSASRFRIRGAKAPQGTDVFLKIEGARSGGIRIEASDLSQAKHPFALGAGVAAEAVTVR
jgi:hypothetical protein